MDKKIEELIDELRESAKANHDEGMEQPGTFYNWYFNGREDGLRMAADKLMSLLT